MLEEGVVVRFDGAVSEWWGDANTSCQVCDHSHMPYNMRLDSSDINIQSSMQSSENWMNVTRQRSVSFVTKVCVVRDKDLCRS